MKKPIFSESNTRMEGTARKRADWICVEVNRLFSEALVFAPGFGAAYGMNSSTGGSARSGSCNQSSIAFAI
jgi:hypothetical protein